MTIGLNEQDASVLIHAVAKINAVHGQPLMKKPVNVAPQLNQNLRGEQTVQKVMVKEEPNVPQQ